VGTLRINGQYGFTFVVRTFAKEFTTGYLQTLFSSNVDMREALRHPVLVAPIAYAFTDVDRTHQPSFVYPYIVGKTISAMLNGTGQLFFHQKQLIIIGVLSAIRFLDSMHSFHGNLNTNTSIVDVKLRPRLISYGLARIASQFRKIIAKIVGVARGDPEFQAQEITGDRCSSPQADGVLLQKLFSDSAPSTPPKSAEIAGLSVSEDPKARPTFAELAEDVSSVGAVGDSMLAYIESLLVCSPIEEAAQQRRIALSDRQPPADPWASGDQHATDLIELFDLPEPDGAPRALLSGQSHKDYEVHWFETQSDTSYTESDSF
jgi:hypothetical protein